MKQIYTEPEQLPIMLNAQDLANALRISRAQAYALLHSQYIKTCRIGKRILLTKTEFLRFIEEETEVIF